jgi:phospholipase D1/2
MPIVAPSRWTWIEAAALVLILGALAAAWKWTDLAEWASPSRLRDALEPWRRSWLGLPLMLGVFIVAELLMFPVLVLIFVSGLAFGPWLGALYALAGALVSALPPYFIGRKLGRKRLERWGGAATHKLAAALKRKGVLAVFLVRKVPAPFTAVNLLCGACGVPLPDFVFGTVLGMLGGTVLITVLGSGLGDLLSDPEPKELLLVGVTTLGAVGLALLLQRLLQRRVEQAT